jgi:hypothetical protein
LTRLPSLFLFFEPLVGDAGSTMGMRIDINKERLLIQEILITPERERE